MSLRIKIVVISYCILISFCSRIRKVHRYIYLFLFLCWFSSNVIHWLIWNIKRDSCRLLLPYQSHSGAQVLHFTFFYFSFLFKFTSLCNIRLNNVIVQKGSHVRRLFLLCKVLKQLSDAHAPTRANAHAFDKRSQ